MLRAANLNLLKVPRDVPDDKVVLLSDILPTAWRALSTPPGLPCSSTTQNLHGLEVSHKHKNRRGVGVIVLRLSLLRKRGEIPALEPWYHV